MATLTYSLSVFVSGVVVLDVAAEWFIDSTVLLAAIWNVDPLLISLLTAGAEWEE
ncbi:hypothetical protein HK098_005920, partial [Nowakowskiella sp. JEL0407]